MDSVSQADSDLEVVVLHHLPQAVVHRFNHLTTGVPEGGQLYRHIGLESPGYL